VKSVCVFPFWANPQVLPPPKHVVTAKEGDDDVEEVELKDMDPLASYTDNLVRYRCRNRLTDR